ncbi:MAG: uracil-DNA glycosylase [Candidatus Binataceae bacterium]|nr:uracil-DNA glycosylase [Candidatus Binataceae bacterium]
MSATFVVQSTLSSMLQPDYRGAMLGCARCPALVKSRSRVVPGDGEVPADVAFVGLAPGRFGGDRTGIPFSGDRSGDLLRRMIQRTNLRRVFITNVVRCNPRDARGRNRDPDALEIANCRSHLQAELALAQPRLVVALGRIAWRELAGRAAPFSPVDALPLRSGNRWLFPMYHPAYVIRGSYTERHYARDFRRLAKLLRTSIAIDRDLCARNARLQWM